MKKSGATNTHSVGKKGGGAGSRRFDEPKPVRRSPKEEPGGRGEPIRRGEEVQQNNDEHIDQDFPGYPHHPSGDAPGRTIHNGSAGAFDATEHSHDEEDEDQDSDDFGMNR